MSKADPEDIVTAVRDDVTVEKSFEPDDFPVPAIAFTIRSERDTAVSVRLVDVVPDDVAPENIGFHPKYGAEFWDVEDGQIVFQREFDPGEEYTTVYGLRGGDADIAAKFMSEPTLESVSETIDNDGTVDDALDAAKIDGLTSSDDGAVDLPTDGESELADDSIPANGDRRDSEVRESSETDVGDGGTDPEGEVTPLDLDDGEDGSDGVEAPSDDEERTDEASDATEPDVDPVRSDEISDRDDRPTAEAPTEDESLASALAAEIRAETVDDDDLATLRDALTLDSASASAEVASPSVDARIEHLQSEVSDLEAYTDALEEFLDEEGDAQTLIAEARDGHEATVDRLDSLESRFSETRSDLDERLEAVDETIDERIDSELDEIRTDLESLEETLESEREARAELESEMEELRVELADVAEMRDRLTSALGGLAGGGSAASNDTADETDGDDE